MLQERDNISKSKHPPLVPNFQEVVQEMRSSSAYTGVFTETFKLIDIILAFPILALALSSFSNKGIRSRSARELPSSWRVFY